MATKAKPIRKTGANTGTAKKRIRKIFGDVHEVVKMPNLIEVQRESYEQFLRSDPSIDYVSGLEKTLRSVFPIRDFNGTSELVFGGYTLERRRTSPFPPEVSMRYPLIGPIIYKYESLAVIHISSFSPPLLLQAFPWPLRGSF